jgi:hypothetical protein
VTERGYRMLYAMSWYIMYHLTKSSSRTFGFVAREKKTAPMRLCTADEIAESPNQYPRDRCQVGFVGDFRLHALKTTPPWSVFMCGTLSLTVARSG